MNTENDVQWLVNPWTVKNWHVCVWKDDEIVKRYHEKGAMYNVAGLAVMAYPWADKIWVGVGGGVYKRCVKVGWVISRK